MSWPRDASVAFILATILLDALGIGVMLPVLPRLVSTFLGSDLGAASTFYGAFVAAYSAMQLLFAPILGGLSDRLGRRPVILISLLGAAINYALLAVAPGLGWLFVGRVIAGITGASFSAAGAYIADITPPERRAQSFGLLGAATGIGFILGPALGGLLGDVHVRLPFVVAAGLNLVNFFYGLLMLPESLPRERRRPFCLRRTNPLVSLARLGRRPIVLGLAGALACVHMAQQILQSVWALFTEARFGWQSLNIGVSLAVAGLGMALVQGGLMPFMTARFGVRRAFLFGLALGAASLVGFGLADSGLAMYVLLLPSALGGMAAPAAQALISSEVEPSEQGELQGSLATLASLAAVAGPLVGGGLFARFAPAVAKPCIPGAPFFAAACFNAAGLLLALWLFARRPLAAAR
ncbi:tetracycline resistance MFS efflux pump [Sorangium cellulosum]|uniref:Tetracycline resistance MFS efflux pump n=1 Tax=Sorangium cellulosum TaxID=56 RepID=A0A3Q8I955_SORCE|nr:TCR/Tet family MFS transporter [Sorangium cellulosum]AUX21453.1 tetracycline resistance MFS efflux pump [Sorangium cellulosum]AYM53066.1 tetracycline resistance MFS efflux pump [Sorangium cellulosum]